MKEKNVSPKNHVDDLPKNETFSSLLTDFDIQLLGEGRHWESYNKLGAQLRSVDGVFGVNFIVWAPNAQEVSVIGDFNGWDSCQDPMIKHDCGLWETFVPGIGEGTVYKYQVKTAEGVTERADPIGFFAEVPPQTASRVANLNNYQWKDSSWMKQRAANDVSWLHNAVSIYEVHLGSWRRSPDDPEKFLSYRDLAPQLVDYVKKMNYTHVEFLPVSEHPLSASWGYQVIGLYSVTSRFGDDPKDFMYLVDLCHQNGIGVIIDWVPAHFPKDGHGLRRFDGTALYEHQDPRKGEHRDWGTLIFNYGRNEVRNYLISNALFWLDKYHIDGLRVDAVASMLYLDYSREDGDWVPNQYGGRENLEAIDFLKEMNKEVHEHYQGVVTIAEESTAWAGVSRPVHLGGLGFSMKWNMGWMNDTLRYFKQDPVYRKFHHDQMTFSFFYAFSENFVLPISHDEVVHGKGSIINSAPGDLWQKFANARLLYSYMWTHPGKKLLFMGNDFGQWKEWNFNESLDWHLLQYSDTHEGLRKCVADLNRLYREEKALHEYDFDWQGFEWIDSNNWKESTFAFIRKSSDPENYLIVAANFTPIPRRCCLGVPEKIAYQEIFCSDSPYYGGSGTGNGQVEANDVSAHGRPASIEILIPPLGVSLLRPVRKSH